MIMQNSSIIAAGPCFDFRRGVIYVIEHPSCGIRYVGKTSNPKSRKNAHRLEAENYANKRRMYRWWRAVLKTSGVRPSFRVIKECDRGELDHYERHYIAKYRQEGLKLFNKQSGGGPIGWDSQRAKYNPSDYAEFRINGMCAVPVSYNSKHDRWGRKNCRSFWWVIVDDKLYPHVVGELWYVKNNNGYYSPRATIDGKKVMMGGIAKRVGIEASFSRTTHPLVLVPS